MHSAFYHGKKVLITGGLGFIGSNLAISLAKSGAEVTLVDSMIPKYGGNYFNIEPVKNLVNINISDVRDIHSMQHLVKNQEFLFNLAGTLSHIDSMTDPFTDLEINCRSQLSILEACRLNNPDIKIIFAGTRGQYGKAVKLPVSEDTPLNPTDVNGINKISGELYHLLYNDVHGIRAVSIRLTNTYGPRHQMRNSQQGYFNWFIRLALDNETIRIYGDGSQKRDLNYIDDVVNALLYAGMSDNVWGKRYNIGSGTPVTLLESARMIVQAAGSGSVEIIPFPEHIKKIEIGDYYADYSKFSAETGWTPKIPFETGLIQTIEYYRNFKNHYWD